MVCKACGSILNFQNLEKERRRGLGSYLDIKCTCGRVQTVESGPLHTVPGTNKRTFEVNSKLPIGAMCTGMGHLQVDKFFSYTFDMPGLSKQTYKDKERLVGPSIERVAKESCTHAIKLERAYTLENLEKLKKMLPPGTPDDFLVYKKIVDGKEVGIVRLFASFDFAWSQRANGYNYDSLNGYGCLIGMLSGMVLDYVTLNRKCRQCDYNEANNVLKEHDYRLDFHGSSKSMEAEGARKLVVDSKILKDANVEIGVFIADNDSSSISAVQSALPYTIIKQSDKNHSKKGVGNVLHSANTKTKAPDQELQNDSIKTLQKYFSYAVKPNVGYLENMKMASKNIPDHEYCGSWCQANVDKKNYGGLQLKNPKLYEELKSIFNKLADNATKFLMAASSQANESLNNSMFSKAPKHMSLSISESSDYRFAATVAQKNYTESFVAAILHALNLQSSMNLANRIQRVNNTSEKRKLREANTGTKRRRIELHQQRSQLKYRKEKNEGISYSSNMSLFDEEESEEFLTNDNISREKQNVNTIEVDLDSAETSIAFENDGSAIVFFDLETGGFDMFKDEVLQVAMSSCQKSFSCYITPTRSINSRASDTHNLTKINTKLFKSGVQVTTVSKAVAVTNILKFLKSLGKQCILVAHKFEFDSRRLLILVESCDLLDEYKKVILGFTDILPLFRKKIVDVQNYKLSNLASCKLAISCSNAHDAVFDVSVLEKLAEKFLSLNDLMKVNETFTDVLHYIKGKRRSKINKDTFLPLQKVISKGMLQRLSEADFSYQDLVKAYEDSESAAKDLLERREKKSATLIKRKAVVNSILDHLKSIDEV